MRKQLLKILTLAVLALAAGAAIGAETKIGTITREDGSVSTMYRDTDGSTRVRDEGDADDGGNDRVYGSDISEKEVRETEKDVSEDE